MLSGKRSCAYVSVSAASRCDSLYSRFNVVYEILRVFTQFVAQHFQWTASRSLVQGYISY